jgi:NAD(P)-dependent dehydrogenase (short-subunit alcohol dehydrogenase family)
MCDGKHFEMADGGSYDGNKAYKDSKLCNILFARELAARLTAAGVGITCNTFSPGGAGCKRSTLYNTPLAVRSRAQGASRCEQSLLRD